MTNTTSHLDADELLHLAIIASRQDAHGEAIEYLKRTIELEPDHAKAYYLLAAEHAQIEMYDRAALEMEQALEFDPSLHIARFQLGLLHLTSGRTAEASRSWQALDLLGEEHCLFQFKRGLELMATDQFDACRAHLSRGLALNLDNAALNTDMQRVLDKLPVPPTDGDANTTPTNHVFLSAYTGGSNTH